jgi:hypothetical protein
MGEGPLLVSLLEAGAAHCRAVAVEHGGLLTTLFMAGLFGGISHCAGMCGPFVLSQTIARLETVPAGEMREFHRLTGAALVPYHLGRTTTYVVLGAVLSVVAGGVMELSGLRWLSAVLLMVAATFFAGYALQRLGILAGWPNAAGESRWSRRLGATVRPLFARPIGWRGYALGLALGFLPCGLLYGALAAAAAAGDALAGGFGMLAFAVGTVPALLAVGLAGHVAGDRFRGTAVRVMPVVMLLNAAALSYFAWRTVA